MKIDPEKINHCPKCHKNLWRKDHRVEIQLPDLLVERTFDLMGCCMHCSAMLVLNNPIWRDPTEAEYEIVAPHLAPVAAIYTRNRALAFLEGMELEEWLRLRNPPISPTKGSA